MGLHTARLIFTILLLIFAIAGLVAGYWFQAIFWALIMMAVGYPFVRNGRVDLYYDDAPTRVIIYTPVAAAAGTVSTVGTMGTSGTPVIYQKLFEGEV